MKALIFYVSVIFLFIGCAGKTSTTTDIDEVSNIIDISAGLKNIQTIKLSEIADSVTFIPFETNSLSIQGQGQKSIKFSSNYIFYYNKYFDWNGKYLGAIGRRGNGPFEEPEGVYNLLFTDNHFYSKGSKFIEYDISGKPTGKLRYLYAAREFKSDDFLRNGAGFSTVGEHFAIYSYPTDVYFFNKNFETISHRRVIEVDSVKPVYLNIGDSRCITYYKDHILFYSFINDTIFYVTNTDLKPKWIVSFDDPSRLSKEFILNSQELFREVSIALRGGLQSLENTEFIQLTDNKHKVIAVYETESYLFFKMTEIIQFSEPRGKLPAKPYIVYYDKRTGKTVRVKGSGFTDDLLGMEYFYPQLDIFDEKMITYIWPFELLDYIDECQAKGCEVNPQLIALSKKIDREDNPVLILVHLKSNI